MKTKKRNRLIEATYYNRNPKEDYAICVFERGDDGKPYDRVITVGSKEYCEDWVENYCRQYSWNRGVHRIKPVTDVNSIEFKRDYFGKNDYEDDFADLEDMLDNVSVSVNRSDVFGESTRKKNTIKLTESELKKIISESVKKILSEGEYGIDSDTIKGAYNAADRKRLQALGTPEYGTWEKKMQSYREKYAKTFDKEHNLDGRTQGGAMGGLRINETMPDGSIIIYSFGPDYVILYGGNYGARGRLCNWLDVLTNHGGAQEEVCRLSPKNAQIVAKWWKHNNMSTHVGNSLNDFSHYKFEEGYNPQFWSKYYGQNNRGY